MELILLIIIAGVAGYLLSRSRLSKPIDDTADKVADTTRKAADSTESWISRTLKRDKKPEEEVLDAQAKPAADAAAAAAAETPPAAEAPPAAKQTSRRRAEDEPVEGGS